MGVGSVSARPADRVPSGRRSAARPPRVAASRRRAVARLSRATATTASIPAAEGRVRGQGVRPGGPPAPGAPAQGRDPHRCHSPEAAGGPHSRTHDAGHGEDPARGALGGEVTERLGGSEEPSAEPQGRRCDHEPERGGPVIQVRHGVDEPVPGDLRQRLPVQHHADDRVHQTEALQPPSRWSGQHVATQVAEVPGRQGARRVPVSGLGRSGPSCAGTAAFPPCHA
jgi:hypothetical protein